MPLIINLVTAIGTGLMFIIQKFFPFLIKKFGLGAVKFGLQKTASVAVVLIYVAFFGAVVIFISETYTQFNVVIDLINNPTSSMSGDSAKYFSCFLYLLNVSGIASGFNSAFSFFISVMIFFFTRGLYSIATKSMKAVSDELNKVWRVV
ncbi:hypothetical protein [Sulfurimonas sp.]|uniref:hypothetical protein n=1 Tax=Sulfurimonas sp. TaxID=2022749 RepID=UPI0035682E1F